MVITYRSTTETLNLIIIAKELNYVSEEDYDRIRKVIEKITNKINSLRNYYLSKK